MEAPEKATNVTWHTHQVNRAERARIKGHGAAVLWFTGLSGAGKSTIANAVETLLNERGVHTYLLDGDNVRHGLNGNLGFSAEDRVENIRRLGEVAKLMVDAGLVTLTAFISPYRADRARVRELLEPGEFIEIHCDTPLATCEARDPKGLYRKARAGEIRDFTGIDAPYETPEAPELVLDSGARDVAALAREVVHYLETHGIVGAADSAA